jgi:hypothetical protein
MNLDNSLRYTLYTGNFKEAMGLMNLLKEIQTMTLSELDDGKINEKISK